MRPSAAQHKQKSMGLPVLCVSGKVKDQLIFTLFREYPFVYSDLVIPAFGEIKLSGDG